MRPQGSLARLGALVLAASLMLGGAACGLVAGLDQLEFKDPAACTEACDDLNPCTENDCVVEGACHGQPIPDGPSTADPIGNCQTVACASGVATITVDDTDLPADDGNACTDESCAAGTPSHSARPNGDPCTIGGAAGVCDGAGACVACNVDADCAPPNDECKRAVCGPDKTCSVEPAPATTQLSPALQTTGDCNVIYCDGAGGVVSKIDDTDLPDDGDPCTVGTCTAGAPANTPGPAGVDCGAGQKCDGAGKCGCADDTQCVAPDTCGGGNPGTSFTCGCTKKTCATLGATCGQVSDGCYATQNCNSGTKNGSETDVDCGGGGGCTKTCTMGKACKAGTDCGSGHCVDGVCCTSACTGACMACNIAGSLGTCSNIASGQPDTNPANACTGTNLCDGAGVCKLGPGQPCTLAGECISNVCTSLVCQ